MTDPIDTSSYAVGSLVDTSGKTTKSTGTLDKDSFLKLLVAQLKYQDPMSPTDSSQFMAQTAQFSMLEQMQNMAKETSTLLVAEQSSVATSMIGKQITAISTTGEDDIVGTVTSVKLGTDGPVLKIGDMEVPLSQVKEVSAATGS